VSATVKKKPPGVKSFFGEVPMIAFPAESLTVKETARTAVEPYATTAESTVAVIEAGLP